MVRRCSVMRMPFSTQRASMVVAVLTVTSGILRNAGSSITAIAAGKQVAGYAASDEIAPQDQCVGRLAAVRRIIARRAGRPRGTRRGGKAGAPARCPRRPPEIPRAPATRRETSEMVAQQPSGKTLAFARRRSTAIDRISASPAATRDMIKPANARPMVTRCAITLRSSSSRSISSSLQPRRNEAAMQTSDRGGVFRRRRRR